MNYMDFILKCFYYLLPIGLANMAPSLSKLWIKSLGQPIDRGKTLGGKPIFGSHKTWRGPVFSPLVSFLIFALQKYLYQYESFAKISLIDYDKHSILIGFLFGFGVVLGELINSFIKRRISLQPGRSFIPLDQIDYTLGGLALSGIFLQPGWDVALTVISTGFVLHIVFNLLGYLIKIKKNKL